MCSILILEYNAYPVGWDGTGINCYVMEQTNMSHGQSCKNTYSTTSKCCTTRFLREATQHQNSWPPRSCKKLSPCTKSFLKCTYVSVAPDGVLTYGKSKFALKCSNGKGMPSGFSHFYCHLVVLSTQKISKVFSTSAGGSYRLGEVQPLKILLAARPKSGPLAARAISIVYPDLNTSLWNRKTKPASVNYVAILVLATNKTCGTFRDKFLCFLCCGTSCFKNDFSSQCQKEPFSYFNRYYRIFAVYWLTRGPETDIVASSDSVKPSNAEVGKLRPAGQSHVHDSTYLESMLK